ncbi:3'(2'),5'-bisphosphate nucleotidase CysQ [Dichotomicrobium thermohalophilum]|uniref:Myo-inositol-1(Or 4)-monophosphatase n=1 Tax=Dichotomicrobium thermohalophilum TaxID=933063 RepID=A0A397PCY4_9HYPH|nr:3'(2'),5'-bisphosphate nucleotidase CysQ [Dichotomicrobium thermohalophilum]RIA47390.1 myo-inositol-1(or 4)-monophosphatase [Dichotomicrobium thermohalophilum]
MTSSKDARDDRLPELSEDYDLLRRAVRDAGATALTYFRRDTPVYHKGDGSEVTDADLAVDAQLHAELRTPRPAYGWLSEETIDETERLDARRVWIVDPIDGTRAFIQDRDQWVISAALVEDGEPVAAAVYNPARDELFAAFSGHGAELNGKPAQVSPRHDLHGALILAPKGVAKRAGWHEPGEPDVRTTFVYSIAYRMCLVAAGRADGLIAKGRKSEWDVAAGTLIVQEAGGRVTSTDGARYRFNQSKPLLDGTIAAPPGLHERLLAAVR